MRNVTLKITVAALCFAFFSTACFKTETPEKIVIDPDNTMQNGYTLTVTNKDSSFDANTKQWMINTFFNVYPKEVGRFNVNATKEVTFIIDPSYSGQAEVKGDTITFGSQWLTSHPDDIDLVTRELMFIVGDYPEDAGPDWIAEGIADYARYKYGVDNEGAGWVLPDYKDGQDYKDSGRIAARFFVWLETRVNGSIVDTLNSRRHAKTYTDSVWTETMGRTLDRLWELYGEDPNIHTTDPIAIYAKLAQTAQEALMGQYWSVDEHYFVGDNHGSKSFNYWWNAHALDALTDAYIRTKDPVVMANMNLLHQGMFAKNGLKYTNEFNDDMEWMAIACLRAYNATNATQYKSTADLLWTEIKKSWSTVAGGGITWKTNTPNGKNACSNGPAAILAARLYQLDHKAEDLEWAKKIFAWEKEKLVDSVTGAVWDNISVDGNGVETIQKDWKFTYNQGTYIGAATELYGITKDSSYLKDAIRTASLVTDSASFSPNGILKGEGGGDAGLFKGIYIRYLNELIMSGFLDQGKRSHYVNYMVANGNSLRFFGTLNTGIGVVFSQDWVTVPGSASNDCSVHLSGVMLFEALADLQRLGLIQ